MELKTYLNQLSQLSLDQMLEVCNQYMIPVHSKTSRVILFSDIASAIQEQYPGLLQSNNPNVNLRLDIDLQPDILTQQLSREIGINLDRVVSDLNYNQVWLASLGVRFLTKQETITSAIVYLIYDNKMSIPREWTFQRGDKYKSIYQMTLSNFIQYHDTFSDDTPAEWLLTTIQDNPNHWTLLDYQTDLGLKTVGSKYLNPSKPNLDSRIGYIFHLGEMVDSGKLKESQLIADFQAINSYPDRRKKIKLAFPPVTWSGANLDIILALPPNRLEKIMLEGKSYFELKKWLQVDTDKLAIKNFVQPDKQVTIDYLVQIIRENRKELRELTDDLIKNYLSIDVANDSWINIRSKAELAEKQTFRVELNPKCINSIDIMGNKILPNELYVTYGDLRSRIGYSFETVKTAFTDSETGKHNYRNMEEPKYTYHHKDIRNLILELQKSKIRCRLSEPEQNYPKDATDLLDFLKRDEHNLDQDTRLSSIPSRDVPIVIKFLNLLFQVGMYQRRWNGQESYPITNQGSGHVSEIASRMTTPLNEAYDLYNSFSSTTRTILDQLQIIGVNDARKSSYLINEFDQVRKGIYCTALAQSDFIYSADYYLRQLFSQIPNFDIKQFKPHTTHYSGILSEDGARPMTQNEVREANDPIHRMNHERVVDDQDE